LLKSKVGYLPKEISFKAAVTCPFAEPRSGSPSLPRNPARWRALPHAISSNDVASRRGLLQVPALHHPYQHVPVEVRMVMADPPNGADCEKLWG